MLASGLRRPVAQLILGWPIRQPPPVRSDGPDPLTLMTKMTSEPVDQSRFLSGRNPLGGKLNMGVMKFRLPSNEPSQRLPDYRKAYITGLDRTPGRVGIELRNGLMTCLRDTTESGRLFVPWPIDGYGTPIIGTATLAERPAPYSLAVELARGKLNDIRNQLADWPQMGLRSTPELGKALDEAKHAFVRAATSDRSARGLPEAAQSRWNRRRWPAIC